MLTDDDDEIARKTELTIRQSLERNPVDVYCDHVSVIDDGDILRFIFRASRPEQSDRFGAPSVTVARVAMRRKVFEFLFAKAAKEFDPSE